MILVACRLFLREDEVSSMRCEDVVPDVTSVKSNGFVDGIAFQVQGKCDKRPVILMMWSDTDFPSLCPVNALLSWMSLSKIKSGYLFPSFNFIESKIKDPSWNGAVEDKNDVINYSVFLDRLKKLCKQLLGKNRGRFGTHSCRKTGYLLGAWGGGSDGELMSAARHKTLANAMKYKKDALFVLELAKSSSNEDISLGTPVWRPQYCENFQLARSVNRNIDNFASLHILAENFKGMAEIKLGRKICTPLDFAGVSSLSHDDVDDVEEALENVLKRHPEDAPVIRALFAKIRGDLAAKNYTNFSLSSVSPSFLAEDADVNANVSETQDQMNRASEETQPIINQNNAEKKRKKARGGNIEIDGCDEIKSLKNPEFQNFWNVRRVCKKKQRNRYISKIEIAYRKAYKNLERIWPK
jgi:hypothetical protein